MVYWFIGFLSFIFIFVLPFGIGTNTFFSLAYKQAGGNINLGRISINFSVKLSENGLEIKGLKIFDRFSKNKKEKNIKEKIQSPIKIKYNKSIFDNLYIDKFILNFSYGNAKNAFKTAMYCNSMNLLLQIIHNKFYDRINDFECSVEPNFNKDYFYFQIKILLKVNLMIIFSIFFKIIIIKFSKIFYRRKENL